MWLSCILTYAFPLKDWCYTQTLTWKSFHNIHAVRNFALHFFQIFNFMVWIQLQFKSKHVRHYIKWLNESLVVGVLWRHHRNHGIILKISWKKFLKNKVPLYPLSLYQVNYMPHKCFLLFSLFIISSFSSHTEKKILEKTGAIN